MALHLGMPFGIIAFLLAVPAWATGNVCTWYAPASPCPSNGQITLTNLAITGTITSSWFQGLDVSSITTVDLSNNNIQQVAAQAFDALTAMTTLALSNNWIGTIPTGIFANLPIITSLSLNGNSIPAITATTFSAMPSLTYLDLTWNKFTIVSANMFSPLPQLNTLLLGYNSLTSLPVSLFNGITLLTIVSFSDNKLTAVPAHFFDSLASLNSVDLSHNNIATMPWDLFKFNPVLVNVCVQASHVTWHCLTGRAYRWLTMNAGVGKCVPSPPSSFIGSAEIANFIASSCGVPKHDAYEEEEVDKLTAACQHSDCVALNDSPRAP
ncbi:unnamed protein product (mitochondrion) [Plasmodiophora brassicae]|uniref:Leucine-rich repeat-containing N-terminal plant-type domain-containing protein n=1 Tax=Plasmodiophora brassicae TaxID=37360 RepID=A0A3P3YLP8_PLABS|nr:unnamed protein product [Plasmodiophora brassicae]